MFVDADAACNSETIMFVDPSDACNAITIICCVSGNLRFGGSRGFGQAMCGISRGAAAKPWRHEPAKPRTP